MTTREFLSFENGRPKRRPSNLEDILFNSVQVGASGSGLIISEDAGAFDFNGKVLTNVVSGTDDSSVVTKIQMQDYVAMYGGGMLSWKDDVITRTNIVPETPTTGDRYLITTGATGDWSGKDNYIVEYSGGWQFTAPLISMALIVGDELNGVYVYSGSAWVKQLWESTVAGTGLSKVNQTISISAGGVGSTELNAAVAGNGLTGGGGSALAVGATDDSVVVAADGVRVSYAKSLTNANGGSITKGQVVYIKTDGQVDLAIATASGLYDAEIGIVYDTTIGTGAAGMVVVRKGGIVDGYTSLTPGKTCYVSKSTAGAIVQDLTGFAAGDVVYEVGYALSATEVIYDADAIMEY